MQEARDGEGEDAVGDLRDLAAEYDKLRDAKVLAKLRAIPSLPDESDEASWNQRFWDNVVYPSLALWKVVGTRRLHNAIPLILDRACFGDPGETMRGMCHTLKAVVQPKWSELTPYCDAALKSERPGTRLWAAHQLIRVRDPDALAALEAAANDPEPEVREVVQLALECTREAAKPAKKAMKQQSRKPPQARTKRRK